MVIRKAWKKDLERVRQILSQWVDEEETEKYVKRVKDGMSGKSEYGMRFWVVEDEDQVVGVCGLADPLPITLKYSKGKKPIEIKILYLDETKRGKGLGKFAIDRMETEARRVGHDEMLVRSGEQFKDTAYGFYQKMGYKLVGKLENNMAVFKKRILI